MGIVYYRRVRYVCEKNKAMETIENLYDKFAAIVVDTPPQQWPAKTFEGICRHLGADRKELDKHIKQETGFSGDEIVSRCCK